jgi:hypothetical protein
MRWRLCTLASSVIRMARTFLSDHAHINTTQPFESQKLL